MCMYSIIENICKTEKIAPSEYDESDDDNNESNINSGAFNADALYEDWLTEIKFKE
jgi:hypothetical protein